MASMGRPRLRDLFDESPTPHIAHPPHTHRRDYYVATDGSFESTGAGLGVIIETASGKRVARLAIHDGAPDNNVAEYRALHLGLDALAARAPESAAVGVLVDHDDLASNVNAAVLAGRDREFRTVAGLSHPPGTAHHWRGIRARIAGFETVRAAAVASGQNPAHPLANAPEEYAHVNRNTASGRPTRQSTEQVPPPSRADRHAGD
ncbi:ribonuclease H family protein [Halodesulfurarchaeum formicicum]|nr:ribonuclease H [Halodesulfurarchaeum formicicum]